MYHVLSFPFEGIVRFNQNMQLSKSSYKFVTSNYIFIIYYITVCRRKKRRPLIITEICRDDFGLIQSN